MSENRNLDFEIFFDNLITKGRIEKEEEIVPGFKIVVRPLNAEEQIEAESVLLASNPMVPIDTIQQVRTIHVLAKAIVSVNGVRVYSDGSGLEAEKENELRRKVLHAKLSKLPGEVINRTYELYSKVMKEQSELFSPKKDEEKLAKKIENF